MEKSHNNKGNNLFLLLAKIFYSQFIHLILWRIHSEKRNKRSEEKKTTANTNMVSLVSRTGRQFQRYTNKGGRKVVGCIPYRYGNNSNNNNDSSELEVLVISSQKGGKAMLFPKGGWEMDESMKQAAERESMEEAGVKGEVEDKLGKWNFKSKRYDTLYEGYMFPLLVSETMEQWPEKDVRTRRWIKVTEAREICQHSWMKEALERFIDRKTASQPQIFEEEEEEFEEVLSPCSI